MRRSHSQQSQAPAEPLLSPEMSRRLDHINQSLHLYEDNVVQSINQEHLAFQSLPPQIQHLVRELRKVKKDIMTGARYIGTELEQIDISMVQVEAATKGLQDALKRVGGRMDGQDRRQTRHEQVTSHLHQTIQAEGAAAMGRDQQLGQELQDTKAQHQRELQNHETILNTMIAELEANKEARERQESHIAELTAAVTSLMDQVKGMWSNPTPEQSAGVTRGGGRGRPPLQCMGQGEAPLILEIMKEEAATMKEEDGWMRDPTHEIISLQKGRKLIRRNMEKLQRTKYGSPGP